MSITMKKIYEDIGKEYDAKNAMLHPNLIPTMPILGVAAPILIAPITPTTPTAPKTSGIEGLIIPPPDIKTVVDKTAAFVAKNGIVFEERIRAKQGGEAKFSFLNEFDHYHAYYKSRIKIYMEGGGEEVVNDKQKKEKEEQVTKDATAATEASAKVAATVVTRRAISTFHQRALRQKNNEKPKADAYTVAVPYARGVDIDIIRLTAQYTAAGGRQFLTGLLEKEKHNIQFAFLKPNNPHFSYFTSLVDAYDKVIKPESEIMDFLTNSVRDRLTVLDGCVLEMEYNNEQQMKKNKENEEVNADKSAFNQIDWHDFVIVETITFTTTTTTTTAKEAPPPKAEEEKAEDKMEVEEAPKIEIPVPKPVAPVTRLSAPGIKIKEGYVPQLNASTRVTNATSFIDPNTGAVIPIDQSAEHMRIALLDPKWQEQKDRKQALNKNSAFAGNDSIVENLNKLATRRADIFTEDADETDQPKAKKARTSDTIIWDGSTASVSAVMGQQLDKQRESQTKVNAPVSTAPLTSHLSAYPPPTMKPPSQPQMPYAPPTLQGYPPQRGFPTPQQHIGSPFAPPPSVLARNTMAPPPPPPPVLGVSIPAISVPPPPPTTSIAPVYHATTKINEEGEEESTGINAAGLVEEAIWKSTHPGDVSITVLVPVDDSTPSWNLIGQILSLSASLEMNVNDFKELISQKLGAMPLNKFQIKNASHGFLKDKLSLAYYNFDQGSKVEIHLKAKKRK